jgi:hypothetical protein
VQTRSYDGWYIVTSSDSVDHDPVHVALTPFSKCLSETWKNLRARPPLLLTSRCFARQTLLIMEGSDDEVTWEQVGSSSYANWGGINVLANRTGDFCPLGRNQEVNMTAKPSPAAKPWCCCSRFTPGRESWRSDIRLSIFTGLFPRSRPLASLLRIRFNLDFHRPCLLVCLFQRYFGVVWAHLDEHQIRNVLSLPFEHYCGCRLCCDLHRRPC